MAGPAVPKVLKNFNLFIGGVGFAGLCEEVKLPDMKIKMEEHRAGGMDMPVAIDLGMDRMEMGFTLAEHAPGVFKVFGLRSGIAVSLMFRAALVDDANVVPYQIIANGMPTDVRLGTVKNGSISKMEATVSLRNFQLSLNDKILIDVDVDLMTRVIDGVDQMGAIRNAIGL